MHNLIEILLSNTIVACVLVLLALTARWLCRRPALSHGIWVLVLLKLLTPPLHTISIPWPAARPLTAANVPIDIASASPAALPGAGPGEPVGEPRAATVTSGSDAPSTINPAPESTDAAVPDAEFTSPSHASSPPPTPAQVDWKSSRTSFHPGIAIAAAWLAGSILCSFIIAMRLRRFFALLRYATPADEDVRRQAELAAHRLALGRCPGVWFVPGAVCPMLIALGRHSRLLIPTQLWRRLTRGQRTTLLLHELAHLRRRDHWIRLLETLATVVYWWHPLIWWARAGLRKDEEQCCDAWVLWAEPGAAGDYATALLEAIDLASTARPLPVLASGMGEFHDLKRRLTMIKRGTTRKALGWIGFLGVCGLGALLLPISPLMAQPAAAPPTERPVLPPPPMPPAAIDPTVANGQVFVAQIMHDEESTAQLAQLDKATLIGRLAEAHERLAEANARVQKLMAGMQEMQARLAKLEAQKAVPGVGFAPAPTPSSGMPMPGRPGEAVRPPAVAPVPPGHVTEEFVTSVRGRPVPSQPRAHSIPAADDAAASRERRIADFEAKLTQLLQEVKGLQADRSVSITVREPKMTKLDAPTRKFIVTASFPDLGSITMAIDAADPSAAASAVVAKLPGAKIMSVRDAAASDTLRR